MPLSRDITKGKNSIEFNDVQLLKANLPISVICDKSPTETLKGQAAKAQLPIFVIFLDSTTSMRDWQYISYFFGKIFVQK